MNVQFDARRMFSLPSTAAGDVCSVARRQQDSLDTSADVAHLDREPMEIWNRCDVYTTLDRKIRDSVSKKKNTSLTGIHETAPFGFLAMAPGEVAIIR